MTDVGRRLQEAWRLRLVESSDTLHSLTRAILASAADLLADGSNYNVSSVRFLAKNCDHLVDLGRQQVLDLRLRASADRTWNPDAHPPLANMMQYAWRTSSLLSERASGEELTPRERAALIGLVNSTSAFVWQLERGQFHLLPSDAQRWAAMRRSLQNPTAPLAFGEPMWKGSADPASAPPVQRSLMSVGKLYPVGQDGRARVDVLDFMTKMFKCGVGTVFRCRPLIPTAHEISQRNHLLLSGLPPIVDVAPVDSEVWQAIRRGSDPLSDSRSFDRSRMLLASLVAQLKQGARVPPTPPRPGTEQAALRQAAGRLRPALDTLAPSHEFYWHNLKIVCRDVLYRMGGVAAFDDIVALLDSAPARDMRDAVYHTIGTTTGTLMKGDDRKAFQDSLSAVTNPKTLTGQEALALP